MKVVLEKVRTGAAAAAEIAGKAADSAGKKAGELMETTKLSLQIYEAKSEIDRLFIEAGKMVYKTHVGEEISPEELSEILKKIEAKYDEIAEMKERSRSIKNAGKCPSCGRETRRDDAFCRSCGGNLSGA